MAGDKGRSKLIALLEATWAESSKDNVPRLGAALAFYTLLSLAPLLVILVTIAAFAYGQEAARGQLVWDIQDLVGADRALALQALLHNAYRPGTGVIAGLLSLVTLLLGASSVVVELQDALNTIWHVPLDVRTKGLTTLVRIIKERFLSFALILGAGLLLLFSVIVNAWIAAMGKFFIMYLPLPELALQAGAFLASFFVITLLFAAIYKILPKVSLDWSEAIIGAAVTSLLFSIGKQLIGLYLGKSILGSTYGAAGSLVMVLVWVYYSAQLFLLGAEVTKVYSRTRRTFVEASRSRTLRPGTR